MIDNGSIIFCIVSCTLLVGCSTSSLDGVKDSCIGVGNLIQEKSNAIESHCRWAETPLQKAKRLKKDRKNLTNAIDQTIKYLDSHPDSIEARNLLSQLKETQIEIIVLAIDQAIKINDHFQIWKQAKEFEYLQRRLARYSPIHSMVIKYITQSPKVQEGITMTEQALMQKTSKHYKSKVPEIKSKSSIPSVTPFFAAFTVLSGAGCFVTGNSNTCQTAQESARATGCNLLSPTRDCIPQTHSDTRNDNKGQ